MIPKNTKMTTEKEHVKHKTGIMGGTFDPIHTGHLILGERAYEQFGLDEVLFMPSGNPPHKRDRSGGASDEERVRMVREAIRDNAHFKLSLDEMHEMGYTYTSITLGRLTQANPGTRYYFIMGADSLFSFESWHEPEVISRLCVIVAAVRDHVPAEKMQDQIRHLNEKYGADIRLLHSPNIDISSHQIREWIREGNSCRYYLHEGTRKYIAERKLYC